MSIEPNPFSARSEAEQSAFVRSREEVEQMNADAEREVRLARLAVRLGSDAVLSTQEAASSELSQESLDRLNAKSIRQE